MVGMQDTFAMARARKALAEAGLDQYAPLERASSVTNEVWLTPDYAVRVNRQPNQRLRREAALGPLLPPEVGYPEVIAYGGQMGADWLVLRRIPGSILSRCWPGMTVPERRDAIRQLSQVLRVLHQAPVPPDLQPAATAQLIGGGGFRAVDPLLAALDKAQTLPHVDRFVLDDLRAVVLDTCGVLQPFPETHLVHGDLHFENVLWDGVRITALLDFEYCRSGPADLDLDVFLRFCGYPFLHVAEDYEHLTRAEDYAAVPWWLADDYPELFAGPHQFDRMRLYSMSYDVRELLDFPPTRPPRELSKYHPYNRLEMLLRQTSHLHSFAGTASYDLTSMDLSSPGINLGYDPDDPLQGQPGDPTPPLIRA